jgi:hypothetical protein
MPGDPEREQPDDRERPLIDLSPALGEAGHEVEELGYEGVPDTGPVLEEAGHREAREQLDDALDAVITECPPD